MKIPINFDTYRKIDDVIWKNIALEEKNPGKHARGRNLSMVAMAPKRHDLMEKIEVDDIIALAQRYGNIRQSLGESTSNQWLIADGGSEAPFQMMPPNFSDKRMSI